jgi:hypothetical protein
MRRLRYTSSNEEGWYAGIRRGKPPALIVKENRSGALSSKPVPEHFINQLNHVK